MSVKINVNLKNASYPIYIGSELIENTAEILFTELYKNKVFIISDTNVSNIYLSKLENCIVSYFIITTCVSFKNFTFIIWWNAYYLYYS